MLRYRAIYLYFFSYFFNAAISFGVVSLLTHKLNTSDYGIINLYGSFLIFLTPLVSCGILHTINVEYFKKDKKQFSHFLSDSLTIPLACSFLFTCLAFIFTAPLSRFLKVDNYFVWLMPVTVFAILVNEVILGITRNQNKPVSFAFFSIGKNVLEAGMSVFLLSVFIKPGTEG